MQVSSDQSPDSEALSAYGTAVEILKKQADIHADESEVLDLLAQAQNIYGKLLAVIGKPAEGRASCESALAINEKFAIDRPVFLSRMATNYHNLEEIELSIGRLESARDFYRQAVELQRAAKASFPATPNFRKFMELHLDRLIAIDRQLGDAEGVAEDEQVLQELDTFDATVSRVNSRLTAISKGEQQPQDNADRLTLVRHALATRAYGLTATRLIGEALASDPKLASDRRLQPRYYAARSAILAASGRSKNEAQPDEAGKAGLRKQTLEWLKAELSTWKRSAMTVGAGNKESAARALRRWKSDLDLAGIRDNAALSKLPEDERAIYRKFWEEVDSQLAKWTGRK